MRKILFLETDFGKLFYHNVYAFYGEPVVFTAFNEYRHFFFCYSLGLDDEQENDLWLIMPISEEKKNRLEQKDIPVIKMMKGDDCEKIKLLKLNVDTGEKEENWISTRNYPYLMPDDTIYISENINWDDTRSHTHKIRVAANNLTNTKLNEITILFSNLIKSIFSKNNVNINLFPQDAIHGSFVFRVKTKCEGNALQENKEKSYSDLLSFNDKHKFKEILNNKHIDVKSTWKLLNLIKSYDSVIQFIDESSTVKLLNINSELAGELLNLVDSKLDTYLESTMVPQANDIYKVKKYLDILKSDNVVALDKLGVTSERQISYYRDACYLLGLINERYNYLTPIGNRITEIQEENEWLKILRVQFENSECGYLWMKNQGVNSILDIDPNSATQYLLDNANGLSEDTAKRRASTLKRWVNVFKTIQ